MPSSIMKSSILSKKILFLEFRNSNKNNALSLQMINELIRILSQKNLEQKYQIIVFRGHNDSSFSAGADLDDIKNLNRENNIDLYQNKLNSLLSKLKRLRVLKISAINKFCIGAGFIFAMYTDICIANQDCLFSIPASKINIKLSKTQLNYLLMKFPKNKLLQEVILSGRKFTALEGYNFNIISIIYPNKNFKKKYFSYLSELVNNNKEIHDYYYKKLYL